jgi:hypothetical protein
VRCGAQIVELDDVRGDSEPEFATLNVALTGARRRNGQCWCLCRRNTDDAFENEESCYKRPPF